MDSKVYGYIVGEIGRRYNEFIFVYLPKGGRLTAGSGSNVATKEAAEQDFFRKFPDGVLNNEAEVVALAEANNMEHVRKIVRACSTYKQAVNKCDYKCVGYLRRVWDDEKTVEQEKKS